MIELDGVKKNGLLLTFPCPSAGHDVRVYLDAEQLKRTEETLLAQGVPFETAGEAAGVWLLKAVGEGAVACPTCRLEADADS